MISKNQKDFDASSQALQETNKKNLAEKSAKYSAATELLKQNHESALADFKVALEDTVKNLRSQHEAEANFLRSSHDSEKMRMENHF